MSDLPPKLRPAIPAAEVRAERARFQHLFSFDLNEFHKRLDQGDDALCVLQGHLFLDHCLSKLLEEGLQNPSAIRLGRMAFVAKIDLALALGLLGAELETPIRAVNKVRNSIVHNLSYQIEPKLAHDIRNGSSDRTRALIDDQMAFGGRTLMNVCVKVVVVLMDMTRQAHAQERQANAERQAAIAAAIDNAARVLAELNGPAASRTNR